MQDIDKVTRDVLNRSDDLVKVTNRFTKQLERYNQTPTRGKRILDAIVQLRRECPNGRRHLDEDEYKNHVLRHVPDELVSDFMSFYHDTGTNVFEEDENDNPNRGNTEIFIKEESDNGSSGDTKIFTEGESEDTSSGDTNIFDP